VSLRLRSNLFYQKFLKTNWQTILCAQARRKDDVGWGRDSDSPNFFADGFHASWKLARQK